MVDADHGLERNGLTRIKHRVAVAYGLEGLLHLGSEIHVFESVRHRLRFRRCDVVRLVHRGRRTLPGGARFQLRPVVAARLDGAIALVLDLQSEVEKPSVPVQRPRHRGLKLRLDVVDDIQIARIDRYRVVRRPRSVNACKVDPDFILVQLHVARARRLGHAPDDIRVLDVAASHVHDRVIALQLGREVFEAICGAGRADLPCDVADGYSENRLRDSKRSVREHDVVVVSVYASHLVERRNLVRILADRRGGHGRLAARYVDGLHPVAVLEFAQHGEFRTGESQLLAVRLRRVVRRNRDPDRRDVERAVHIGNQVLVDSSALRVGRDYRISADGGSCGSALARQSDGIDGVSVLQRSSRNRELRAVEPVVEDVFPSPKS